jgi:hypothetical protein
MSIFSWLRRSSLSKAKPQLFEVDLITKAASSRISRSDHCACLSSYTKKGNLSVPNFHTKPQDKSVLGWELITRFVDEAAHKQFSVLEPSIGMTADNWQQVTTLPTTISDLKSVRELRLYGSHLQFIPPEIGQMVSLVDLDIYTSYSLHWLPYEVTRCTKLKSTRISTRALYGNEKTRLPFPRLSTSLEAFRPRTCSICDSLFTLNEPQPWWITLRVGTDNVPLLVHSCSDKCTTSLPAPPAGYYKKPHKGGGGVGMPDPDL